MQISSYQLAEISEYLVNQLQEIRRKIKFYADEECKKRQGSNFALEISEQDDIFLIKFVRVLRENENIVVDSDIVSIILENYKISKDKFAEFDKLLDTIYGKENGSFDDAFFYIPFSRWFEDFYENIKSVYLMFLEKIDLNDIISNKKEYEKIVSDAKNYQDNLQKLLNDTKVKVDETLLKLEQKVAQNEVLDIKKYYTTMIDKIKSEKTLNAFFYYGLSGLLVAFLIILFFYMKKIYINDYLLIPKSILSCTLIGFWSFIINDFRRRFNITKYILDELEQKEVVVDTYSSLLSRINDFDQVTKKKYHEKIIQNIIDTLLAIKNHGYLSKIFNQTNPTLSTKIIEELGNIMNKKS